MAEGAKSARVPGLSPVATLPSPVGNPRRRGAPSRMTADPSKPIRNASADQAEALNQGCYCTTLDRDRLAEAFDWEVGVQGFAKQLSVSHPTLFSNTAVFLPIGVLDAMKRIVDAIEAAARLPSFRTIALAAAPHISGRDFGPVGALMGYDFHITLAGPQLIEVNTNAGGAFLNAVLARSQHACCAPGDKSIEKVTAAVFSANIAGMFRDEWRLQRGGGGPKLIAIVDDAPEQQHLYPEFEIAKALLEREGFEAVIGDASLLTFDGGSLMIDGRPIDLVYNRLVDFGFDEPRHGALRSAYESGAVVVTPNPHVHALLADKRNLAILSDSARLAQWGLPTNALIALENGVPKTRVVSAANADELWCDRAGLFFKPARGHGSKAAYRGDKLTRRVWLEIAAGDYVAQAYAAPSLRGISQAGEQSKLKIDIRLYTYAGSLLIAAARLYQGQTTNMRTPGGGFAPVLIIAD